MNTAAQPDNSTAARGWFTSRHSSDEGGNCLDVACHPAAFLVAHGR